MIKRAMDWIWYHCSPHGVAISGKAVRTINMFGFSRGSVNAVVVAWFVDAVIKRYIPNIEVNLFLFNTVGGAKGSNQYIARYTLTKDIVDQQFAVDIRTLPPVVKNFKATLAANMSGWAGPMLKDAGFVSTLPARNRTPNYEVVVMPGGHNSGTKWDLENKGSQIGRIGISLAQEFLCRHGSQFQKDFRLSQSELVEAFSMARNPNTSAKTNKDKDYRFFGNSGVMRTSGNRRDLALRYDKQLQYRHRFWINDQHRRAVGAMLRQPCYKLDVNEKITNDDFTPMQQQMYPQTLAALKETGWFVG